MRRFGIAATTALLAAVGALGLTACGSGGSARDSAQDAVEVAAGVGAYGQALEALGFNPVDLEPVAATDPKAGPGGSPTAATDKGGEAGRGDGWRKRHRDRALLRKDTLHGEVVVQTKDGTKTIVVQRGTVTAIDDKSMTVKSTDGFTMTWTFGDNLRVVERRKTVQPEDVQVGAELGVAGAKDGDQGVARLVVIPRR